MTANLFQSISWTVKRKQMFLFQYLKEDGAFHGYTIMLHVIIWSSFLVSERLDLLVSSVKETIILELYRRKWQGGNMNVPTYLVAQNVHGPRFTTPWNYTCKCVQLNCPDILVLETETKWSWNNLPLHQIFFFAPNFWLLVKK